MLRFNRMKLFLKLALSIIICELVGVLSTPFTIASIPNWYAHLHKPFFSPPDWVFGPVWTTLYFLMGVSVFLIWQKGLKNKKIKKALIYFTIQLVLNFLWSVLFFGLHSIALGLIDIVALLASIIITMVFFYRISKISAYLLLPYLLWVSFATLLNISLLILNY